MSEERGEQGDAGASPAADGPERASPAEPPPLPSAADVRAAARRIVAYVHRTPVMRSSAIDDRVGARLFFKCENLQRCGAFKFRGACNAVFSLTDEQAARGVATHSSGNHGQALARAAQLRGIPATVVMPEGAPATKRAATEAFGARVISCEPTLEARERALAHLLEAERRIPIHPYDHVDVIAGQGTAALELLEDVPELDAICAPIGGGGLFAGTAIAAAASDPRPRVVAAEPALADDAYRSLEAGRRLGALPPRTIADGLRTALSDRTFCALRELGAGVLLAREETIREAMRLVFARLKLVVEPSAAVPLAALLDDPEALRGQRVGVILSGGNVDLDRLAELLVAPG